VTRTTRNLTALLMSQLVTWVIQVATLVILPKTLGVQTYGVLAFATTFVGFLALISNLGSNTFLVKTIARGPSRLGVYTFNGLVMKLILGTCVALVAIVGARLLGYPSQTVLLVEAGCIGMVLASMTDILNGALQGTQRMGRLAFWATVQQLVSATIALGLLLDHKGVVVYALVIGIGGAIPLVAIAVQLWPEIHGGVRLDLHLWKTIAEGGMPFFLWSGILLTYGSIDILMLQEICGSKTVGRYVLAYTWVGLPIFFASILSTVLLPSLSTMAHSSASEFCTTVNRALRLVVFAGAPMAIGIALVANNIISLFHYPSTFDQAIPLIRILAIHIPIVGMDMVLAMAINAKDRQKAWLMVGCVAAVFNPLVNFIAIPLTVHLFANGAIGASVVTVVTEVLMMIGAIYLKPAGVLDGATISFLVRTAAASLVMIPPVLLAARAPFPMKIAIGMGVFSLAALALRLVSVREGREGVSRLLRTLNARAAEAAPTPLEQA